MNLITILTNIYRPSTDPKEECHAEDETYGQVMTEYWIEPQMGKARVRGDSCLYIQGKDFKEIGDAVSYAFVLNTLPLIFCRLLSTC